MTRQDMFWLDFSKDVSVAVPVLELCRASLKPCQKKSLLSNITKLCQHLVFGGHRKQIIWLRRREDLSPLITRIYCVLIANMLLYLLMEMLIYFALPNLQRPDVGLGDKTCTQHKVRQILYLCMRFTWDIYLTNFYSHVLLQRAIKL